MRAGFSAHRHHGQRARPRDHDARGHGQHRSRAVRPHDPHRTRRRDQPRSTRPTSTPAASPRRSSARPSRVGATTSCWRRSSACPWAPAPTNGAVHPAGSNEPSRTASDGSTPTTSTCTRCTDRIIRPTSTKPSQLCPTWSGRQSPGHRDVDVPGRVDRGSAVGGPAGRAPALPHRTTAVFDADPDNRGQRAPDRPTTRDGSAHLRAAQRWLAVGPSRARPKATGPPPRRAPSTSPSPPTRASSKPSTDSRTSPARPGWRWPIWPIAFVRAHPAVTSVLIGPRRPEHLRTCLPAPTSA